MVERFPQDLPGGFVLPSLTVDMEAAAWGLATHQRDRCQLALLDAEGRLRRVNHLWRQSSDCAVAIGERLRFRPSRQYEHTAAGPVRTLAGIDVVLEGMSAVGEAPYRALEMTLPGEPGDHRFTLIYREMLHLPASSADRTGHLDEPVTQGPLASYLSLLRLAYYDGLCGVANRRALEDHLGNLVEADSAALVLLDLDNYRTINEGYGHAAGDRVLLAVSRRIIDCNDLKGFVARLGGDEFAVAVNNAPGEETFECFVDRILTRIAQPIELDGGLTVSVSASAGIAYAATEGGSVSQLIKRADAAVYRAKQTGRNRHVTFRPGMLPEHDPRIFERGALAAAIEDSQLIPVFQPVISALRRDIVYHEALVRWHHPELGVISPAVFLPAFVRFGLICRLSDWMLERAVQVAARSDSSVAINITTSDLMRTDFVDRCLALLDANGLRRDRLRLEITEGELIENYVQCQQTIARLRTHGLSIYIDDFGVGYASLAYLRRLPVDGIKLDRSFLQDFPHDSQAVDVVSSIIGLAHQLDLEVTAEGVETLEQGRLLAELGCDYLQGYLFGRPALAQRFLRPGKQRG